LACWFRFLLRKGCYYLWLAEVVILSCPHKLYDCLSPIQDYWFPLSSCFICPRTEGALFGQMTSFLHNVIHMGFRNIPSSAAAACFNSFDSLFVRVPAAADGFASSDFQWVPPYCQIYFPPFQHGLSSLPAPSVDLLWFYPFRRGDSKVTCNARRYDFDCLWLDASYS